MKRMIILVLTAIILIFSTEGYAQHRARHLGQRIHYRIITAIINRGF